jgi:hypothetical protein
MDMEATEMAVRQAMHEVGAKVLTGLLRDDPPLNRTMACACGGTADYIEMRPKSILTVVGWVKVLRAYYLCSNCHVGHAPMDKELDVERINFSPGVRRMMALVGHHAPFDFGRQEIASLAGLMVTAKAVERTAEAIGADIAGWQENQMREIMRPDFVVQTREGEEIPIMYIEIDATGIPIVPWELDRSKPGKEGDTPRTREAKLGCVFTQTGLDAEGRPVRDTSSTSYVAAIETSEEFGPRIYAEARRRGLDRAKKVVVIADGAPWIWILARLHFPGAIEILDLYHAREHLWKLAAKLFPSDEIGRMRWIKRFQQKLDNGKIKSLVADLRSISAPNDQLRKAIQIEADYYEKNAHRMQYPDFRRQGLFVGSGVIEAGCKTVIGSRLKMSGMFWTVKGANAILALRCNLLNGDFEDYWHQRPA